MGKKLEGKNVVVTGSGRGIGRAVALLAAAEGAKVVVNDPGVAMDGSGTDKAPADQVVDAIRSGGGTAVANYDSVASVAGGENIIKTCVDSFGRIEDGEVWVHNIHISAYSHTGYARHDETRPRKLLLHKSEIRKLIGKVVERGMTLVPVRMYFKDGRVKVAISLAKGKKEHDRRETIRRRETDRETRAAIKERRRE
jgi:SsrA-binding protein